MYDLSEIKEVTFLTEIKDYGHCMDIAVKGILEEKSTRFLIARVNIDDIPKLQRALEIS